MQSIANLSKTKRWYWLSGSLILLLLSATAYGVVWYHRFYHHVTVQELSHEVRHATFQTTIRGASPITLQLYQQENAAQQPVVLFTSGDGGWSHFCYDVAADIASMWRTVVGLSHK